MKKETLLMHIGLAGDKYEGVVNMPVARASTLLFRTYADFEAGERGEWPLPTYGRYGNPTQTAFEEAMAALEGADKSIAFSSGLAAIVTSLMAFVKTGDRVLMVDSVYGPVRRFCDHELKRLGVETVYYDPTIGEGLEKLITPNTKVVYCESPGSLTFEMQDVPAIAAAAHKVGAVVVADSTWATPLYFDAFAHGVDISMHSATKYISGHSDFVMGVLSCKEAHYKQLLRTSRDLGSCPSADNCSLALRGMRTMGLRLKHHYESAIKVANWLCAHPFVKEVLYPALPGSKGHDLWKRDMKGASALFAFTIPARSREQLAAMLDGMEYFGLGYSWGGFESLIIPCNGQLVRTAGGAADDTIIRVHIGLEDTDDLINDLAEGLKRAGA